MLNILRMHIFSPKINNREESMTDANHALRIADKKNNQNNNNNDNKTTQTTNKPQQKHTKTSPNIVKSR